MTVVRPSQFLPPDEKVERRKRARQGARARREQKEREYQDRPSTRAREVFTKVWRDHHGEWHVYGPVPSNSPHPWRFIEAADAANNNVHGVPAIALFHT